MQLDLSPAPLAPDSVQDLITLTTNQAAVTAARHATGRLRSLFERMEPGDLLRRAVAMPDGVQWLQQLAAFTDGIDRRLMEERAQARDLREQDRLKRSNLDAAAVFLLNASLDAVRGHEAFVQYAEATEADFRRQLSMSGLAAAEIDAVVATRAAAGVEAGAPVTAAKRAIGELNAKHDALASYLRDPLRDASLLPADLLGEVVAMAHQQANMRASTPPSDAVTSDALPA
jgi:hypothetical protein